MNTKTVSKIVEKDCFKTFRNLECLLESWFNQYALGQNILLCSKGFTEKYLFCQFNLFNYSISDDNKKFSKIVEKDYFTTFKSLEYFLESWFNQYSDWQQISLSSILIKLSTLSKRFTKGTYSAHLAYFDATSMAQTTRFIRMMKVISRLSRISNI